MPNLALKGRRVAVSRKRSAIPDEVLVARDAGQVLFFCGAGVSTAKARLPGFLGLADKVLNQLRALPDSPARQLMKVVGELQKHKISGVGGIVAADRIFGLLEREFALGISKVRSGVP